MNLNRRALLAAAAIAVPGVARARPTLAGSGGRSAPPDRAPVRIDLPIAVTNGVPWTPASFDGSRRYPMALDMRWNAPRASPDLIRELGLSRGERDAYRYNDLDLSGTQAGAGELVSVQHLFNGQPVRAALGLRQFRLPFVLDWDLGRLSYIDADWRRFRPPSYPVPAEAIETAALSRPDRSPWNIRAELDGQPVVLGLVSHQPYALLLEPPAFDTFWDRFARRRDDQAPTGEVFRRVAVAPTLTIAGAESRALRLDNVLVQMNRGRDVTHLGSNIDRAPRGLDGFIGFDVLRRMNLIADPVEVKLRLWPSRQHEEPYWDDRAGLTLAYRGEWAVLAVDPQGPAYRAGLRRGDYVTEHRGAGGLEGLSWALVGPAGTVVDLSYVRGTQAARQTRIVLEDRV